VNVVSLRAFVACMAAVSLVGCGSSGGSTGGGAGGAGGAAAGGGTGTGGSGTGAGGGGMVFTDGGGLTTQATFCADYTKAYCDREQACMFLDQAQYADCAARVATQCATAFVRITSGLRTYVPEQGFACIGAVKADACSTGRNILGGGALSSYSCLTSLGVPAGMPGNTCLGSTDCIAAVAHCAFGAGADCRTCKAYVPQGMPCDSSSNLCKTADAYNYCKTQGDGGRECQLHANVGGNCSGVSVCNPLTTGGCINGLADGGTGDGGTRTCLALRPDGTGCNMHPRCVAKYCNYNSRIGDAGPDVCGYRVVGQSCGDTEDCNTQNYCKGLVDVAPQPFVPGICAARIGSGGACVVEATDISDGCQSGEICLGGICRVGGNQMLNQPCGQSSDCVASLYCETVTDGGSGTCVARAAAGQPCSPAVSGPNPLCVAGTTCPAVTDGGITVCASPTPLSSLGGGCASNTNCKGLLQCNAGSDGGTCGTYAMAGSNCDAGTVVCTNGNTALGFCAAIDAGTGVSLRTCSNPIGNAGACTSAGQCASGRCVNPDGGFGSTINPGNCAMACLQ